MTALSRRLGAIPRLRRLVARVRAASAAADRQRHELERRIALYSAESYCTARQRQELDRVLDEILGRDTTPN